MSIFLLFCYIVFLLYSNASIFLLFCFIYFSLFSLLRLFFLPCSLALLSFLFYCVYFSSSILLFIFPPLLHGVCFCVNFLPPLFYCASSPPLICCVYTLLFYCVYFLYSVASNFNILFFCLYFSCEKKILRNSWPQELYYKVPLHIVCKCLLVFFR